MTEVSVNQQTIADANLFDQLDYLEDQLMGFIVQDFDNIRLQFTRLQSDFFRNENFVLFKMFRKITSEKGVLIDENYLKIYLQAHKHEIALDKDRIEFDTFSDGDLSGLDGLLIATLHHFRKLTNPGYLEEKTFDDALLRFRNVFASLELQDVLQSASTALNSGIYYRRKQYTGVEGAIDFIDKKVNVLKALTSEGESYTLQDSSEDDYDELDSKKPTLLARLTAMPTLDNAMRGIRSNSLITMVAPEKGMKSKLATRATHSVMLNGHNVTFWGKEGGSAKVKAELRAIHFDHYYNVERGKNYPKISSTDILFGDLPSNIKELEKISWMDLFKSQKYGKLFTPDYPFKLEELENVIRQASEVSHCKMVVLDYLQIIESDTVNDQRVVIEKAYKKVESLKGILDICIWCPAQMSTEAIKAFSTGQHKELRNLTSHSNEPTKSSDINFLVYVNDEMERKNVAKVYGLPSRTLGSFEPFDVFRDPLANQLTEVQGQTISFVDGEMVIKAKGGSVTDE